jgi:aminotransferase
MKDSLMSNAVTPSLTRKLFNMALEIGQDVVNLTLGDPDVLTPIQIREAACKAIMEGKTRYSANAGLEQTRKAYASFFKKEYGIGVDPNKNVIATVGGMEALFLALASMIDKDDEVIILAPYYVNYLQMIKMCQGKAIVIDRLSKDTQELIDEVENNCNEKTQAIILNSPCNPVGDILPSSLLDGIANIAKQYDLTVISDEVYNSLIYDGKEPDSIIGRDGMYERTIIIDSCSKRFAMTGWRIGFAVGPAQCIANMTKMQENVAACAPLPSQYAAIAAYSEPFDYSYINKEYEKRRNLVYGRLKKMSILHPIYPEATFYCFVNITDTGLSSEEFAYQLLEKKHVAVVPGKAYGDDYDNYIRIAFTLKDDLLVRAMDRLEEFVSEIGK